MGDNKYIFRRFYDIINNRIIHLLTLTQNVRNSKLKKVLYTDFVTTGSLVEELLDKKEIKKAITRSNLYKFWNKVAGKKFAEKSKPYSMMPGGVMVIACENAIVAQELTLRKFQLLAKFEPYLKSLKIKVTDLRFDPKRWVGEADSYT